MDERHWWIAGKIQESFRIGGFDNPTLLEDFMCEASTMAIINSFLNPGGQCRLFFYCDQVDANALSTRQLHTTANLASLKDINLEVITILYFLRQNLDAAVDVGHMERDIFCGELKGNTITNLNSLLSDIYVPLMKVQKNWGSSTGDAQNNLVHNLDKVMNSLTESTASLNASKHIMLKQPENVVGNEFKQHRLAALDHTIITEYEDLVTDWMNTIESILHDTSDERFLDPNAGPLSELERWKRRQRMLTSITEQLKSKECKGVIGVLITAKSRLLKRWKSVDSGITDAMNETKDKVRYLESLRRHFDLLYADATPAVIINTALPGFINTVKQMDSVSRFYARQGFLGLLLTKVTNQLVLACKEYIQLCTVESDTSEDNFWKLVQEEIANRDAPSKLGSSHLSHDQQKAFQTQMESRIKIKRNGSTEVAHEGLFTRLKACLMLHTYYRDSIRSLRDALGVSHSLSHANSISSLAGPVSAGGRRTNRISISSASPSKKAMSQASSDLEGHGVPIADEETVLGHLDSFCSRIKQILDIINTFAQFDKMLKNTSALPRPRKDDLVFYENDEKANDTAADEAPTKPQVPTIEGMSNSLDVIDEDEERLIEKADRDRRQRDVSDFANIDEAYDAMGISGGLTKKDVEILKEYYPYDQKDEGPSIFSIIQGKISRMIHGMIGSATTSTMLDVESKDKGRFEEVYSSFIQMVMDIEKFFAAYLNALFMRKIKTHEALDLMMLFSCISQRPGVRMVISEKFVEIFNWYESDLEEVQCIYERHKDDPLLARNAPPVAGAIGWSRNLLSRIEEPMKIFRENKAVSNLRDYSRIVKIYNRLATALVTFESLWFTHWKQSIEQARSGLYATLFILHPETREIMVNVDSKVLELMQEAKWLKRMNIQIPESASQIVQKESRFKGYHDHLQLCLNEYKSVCAAIPEALLILFKPHIDACLQNFQPGLSTLAWNSMNIDPFLHQIHTGTAKLKFLVNRVNSIMANKVERAIENIRQMIFFDHKLAFSRSWPPEKFIEMMGLSIGDQSKELTQYIHNIEVGIKECANILTGRKMNTWANTLSILRIAKFWKDKALSRTTEERAHFEAEKIRGMEELKRKAERAELLFGAKLASGNISSTKLEESLIAPKSYEEEETMVNELLDNYRHQIYAAILLATTRSLVTLAESSGCDGEVIRAASVLSFDKNSSHRLLSDPTSRVASAISDKSRPVSVLSLLSNMTWTTEKSSEVTHLQFEVNVKFAIPNIVLEPNLDAIQTALNFVARSLLQVPRSVKWTGDKDLGSKFFELVQSDEVVDEIMMQISQVVEDLQSVVKQHINHFGIYDFLWQDDMYGNYYEFIEHDPGKAAIHREVERLLKIERKVLSIPKSLPVGPICLMTSPVQDALHGFAMAWKNQYASVLHDEAKRKLDAAVLYRANVRQRLELPVLSLDQLNSTLHLLEEVRDMENKIDDIYLPIETHYAKLREFELRLPRSEVEEVDQLRDHWQELLSLADGVCLTLLKEKRGAFEQELDKQVKNFVVEVIQFRNAFDAQGPAVPGIPPSEAVKRLQDFLQRYSLYEAKRKTLDSVSKLFGIPCKPFPELDKTGEELELLGLLYGLFQKFIRFDDQFRDTLWAEVELQVATHEVESFWDECLALPSKLKDWDAYNDMKNSIQLYRDLIPLLHKLASKEIRNRHWLQVMAVTGSSFQLEAAVFKLSHLLDIGLITHRPEIEEICRSASRELELEVKLRMTEEEWTEQVLNFEPYKKRGPMYLDKTSTERLLEQLEDAQALLAQMLTSRYVGPLREEAASWAEKLKEVGQVLDQWLEVQDLWQYLEAVFSNETSLSKELPQEAKRFARIDKGWTKMMKRAYDTRNVLQCCYGEDVPKGVVLRHIYQELEICFKSLIGYLDVKRRAFPRFFVVSDQTLLAMLSRPHALDSVRPHFKSLFSAISDVTLERQQLSASELELQGSPHSSSPRRNPFSPAVESPVKIDKRLTQVLNLNRSQASLYVSTILPSENINEESITMEATAVMSSEGEFLPLIDKVPLTGGVEVWLENLRTSVKSTLHEQLLSICYDISNNVPCDEWPNKYTTQVCRLGLLYYWTRECEVGITEIKFDRKALSNLSRKFGSTMNKLPLAVSRSSKGDEKLIALYRLRVEQLLTNSIFLRDSIDAMATRRLRENTDFEWRRNLRLYVHDVDDQPTPCLYMLENCFPYGCEFYGAQPTIALTAFADKCFLSLTSTISSFQGAMVSGESGVGKSETVKGYAQIMGQFLMVFQCSPKADSSSLSKMVEGMAMDGCWGCFDDIETLNPEGVSVLIDHVQSILDALRSAAKHCTFGDGQEISVHPRTAFFMTCNLGKVTSLDNDVRVLFRQVNLVQPDLGIVLKAKCSSYGLKSPHVLANRLRTVAELSRDQLSDDQHHELSVEAICGVLRRVVLRRRVLKEEKSFDKKPSDMQESRSNSVLSTSNHNLQQQQSVANISGQKTRKAGTPNPLSAAAKIEHGLVGQLLMDMIGPRLTPENLAIFRQIVKDIFSGLPESPPGSAIMSANRSLLDVETALENTAAESGLVVHKAWKDKCMQLFAISQVHQGIILAGPPGSGKSTIVQTLVDALCTAPRGLSRGSARSQVQDGSEANHKLQKIFPAVVDDLSLVFGHLNQNHDWVDGIFTSVWKKASRNQSTTWICLDGPLHSSWVDNFSSILDASKMLHLANGDQLPLSNNIKLLFETDDINEASPALIARCGILFVDKDVVGWRPIAKAWLDNRTQQELHVLQRAFDKTVDPVAHYVLDECKPRMRLSEVGMFCTTINLLSAMLADNIEIGGELHIERLYLFCLMWTFGGMLETKDRKGFNELLSSLSTALPDDDRDICFFDYYVDESGEWDPWQSRVPEATNPEHLNLLGEVFVDTVDTIRTRLLMELACASSQNVLLVGAPGSGKTSLINDFLSSQDYQQRVTTKLVSSGSSTAKQLQHFIESNIHHRQGFVYGAKENKHLQLFLDDLNLPQPDEHGVQRSNELLRRLLDDHMLCTLSKPFEWRTVESLTVISAMSINDSPSMKHQPLSPRLLRHFTVLSLPVPSGDSLTSVVHGVLEASMLHGGHAPLESDLHQAVLKASCRLLTDLRSVLKCSPLPGRYHYLFTLRDFVNCFQCLRRLPDESRADEKLVASLWKHETERIIKDQLCRYTDIAWFEETMTETLELCFPKVASNLFPHFVTFPIDARTYQRPVTTISSRKEVKVMLQPVESLQELHGCLQTHLNRYNEEFGNVHLDIMLSENIIFHIIKMHRVICYHHSGSFLVVGPIGSHLGTLIQLALHVASIPLHAIDSSKENNFLDGLRSAVRLCGAEGKSLTLSFNGRDLINPLYMDAINSLLVSGEYPHLFTNDEMEGLLQAIGPAMKREHSNFTVDPAKYFVSRVRTNLHIVICLPPTHPLLKIAPNQYPGLISGCQLIWMCDWTKESLLGEAAYFLNKSTLTKDCENDLSENVMAIMANIHSFVLQDCRQCKWAGDTNEELTLNEVKVNEKKKELLKVQTRTLPNRPFSKAIMLESIKLKHKQLETPSTSELFVGPTSYKRFMKTFKCIYTKKAKERTQVVGTLKKALSTLDQTRDDAQKMRQDIRTITLKFENAREKTGHLLSDLTLKATALEKLRAQLGMSTSLSAFLQLNEMSDEEEEDTELLKEDERDEYDDEFDRMRAANLKTRLIAAKDEHTEAVKTVASCRDKLAHARQQVLHWRGRVDRQCVERLKAFQNPPMLVGHVLEMVMTLIGKRLPSQRLETKADNYPTKEEQSGRFTSSSSSTKFTGSVKKSKSVDKSSTGAERFDRAQWKSMQQMLNDTAKFVDIMHNVAWEDGLPDDVRAAVESYLARSRDGLLGVTGEGSLLDNAQEKERGLIAQRRSPSPDNTRGISIAAAKYASEDAATLVNYTIAIVEYTRLCGPLKAAMERRHELEREIEENDRLQREQGQQEGEKEGEAEVEKAEEEELTEKDLPRLQEEVQDLQAHFDAAVVEKHSLEMELTSMKERLKAATNMIGSLKPQEASWRQYVEEHISNDMLVANSLAAAAFLTYCSAMNADCRSRLGEFFITICEHHNLPLPPKKLFKNMSLMDFLEKPLMVYELRKLNLPTTPLMLENSALLMQGDTTMAWPLLCDPVSHVLSVLRSYLNNQGLVEVSYTHLRSQFDTCLAEGLPLLITDVDVHEFIHDQRFRSIIYLRNKFVSGQNPFKMKVGEHEVECQPHFRMYLHTTSLPHEVPPELAAHVGLLYFHQTREDVEEQLLDRFMRREKMRLDEEKRTLLMERMTNSKNLEELEQEMVQCLSSEVRLLNDLSATKKLAELKKQHEETEESQCRVDTAEQTLSRARESFRVIAKQGAVCFDTMQYMREINAVYKVSFVQMLELFDQAVSHSDRAAVKAVVDRLMNLFFVSTTRFLSERDKQIYCLLLALEVEDAEGRVGRGEREYLISPSLGSVTMTALGCSAAQDSKFVQAKKPFDWMNEDQFSNLQILAIHYEWFQDMFDRMPKDGRETQWRNLCESDQPEMQPLPDRMDDQYTLLQRMLVIRAVRSDRLNQVSVLFINNILDKKLLGEGNGLDLTGALRQAAPKTPLLMLYTTEKEAAERAVLEFAARKQVDVIPVSLSGPTQAIEKVARKSLAKAMATGCWLLLQNGHSQVHLLNSLELMFSEQETIDPNFRCWITAEAKADLPTTILQSCVKIMIDKPRTIRDQLVRTFSSIDAETLRHSSKVDWLPLLHNICYLHGALKLRSRFGRGGFNKHADFTQIGLSTLVECINLAKDEFMDNLSVLAPDGSALPRSTSWSGLRFMVAEVFCGNFVEDPLDQQSLTAMVEYWLSSNACKKDFELPRIKYKIPAVFFNQNVRQTQLVQALESTTPFFLESAEACNLHPSSETLMGDDQYIFTRLNKIYDAMPSSQSLTHKLFPRPPSPFDGPPMANISAHSNNPQIVHMGVFASASFATLKMKKEVELWEVCHLMAPKVPRAYSKDYITERIKKVGGFTSFNMFIMKELDIMYQLITDIKTSLQAIKAACELTNMGEMLTPTLLGIADDLYHLRIPHHWCRLAGNTAPPPNYALGTWLTDLANRCQHFERILVLGREKMPAYWLGAFTYPRGLLALLKQDCYRHHPQDRSGAFDQYVFQTEVTARDKDHIRDPPAEGMFIFGIYLWGCAWEKTTGDLIDTPPRHACAALPVIHLTCWPQADKPILQDASKASEIYACPVYQSRIAPRRPILELDLSHSGVPSTRWSLRGLSATIRPY